MSSKKVKKLIIVCLLFIVVFGSILLFFVLNENKNKEIFYNEESKEIVNERYEVNRVEAQKIDEKYIKEANEYNYLEIKATTQERIMKEYLEHYKEEALNYIEDAYESLDEQFRKAKFNTLQEYEQYVNDSREQLENAQLSKYKINEYNSYTEYICLDQYNNYYVFHITNPGNYKLYLDTYTVDLPEFIKEYESGSDQEKVILNTNKFITALNAKDYKYIYSKLADSFKNNYFQNEEALKEFLVNNLYENNEIDFEEFSREGTNLYTYKVKITKILSEEEKEKYYGKNAPSQYMNIVMQLNEGTDFVMSFSIEE